MVDDRVVVVGGGVVGGMSALWLARLGRRVTVLDEGAFGGACSRSNCGLISPSHALPLAVPGAVRGSLPMLLRRDAPLRIALRWDLDLARWLWRFARRCRVGPAREAASARRSLLDASRAEWEPLLAEEEIECEWEARGCLFVFRDKAALDACEAAEALDDGASLPARRLDAGELVELEPALRPDLAGALHHERDAHLRPDRLLEGLRRALERRGVEIVEGRRAERLVSDGARARSVVTDAGAVDGDAFVVATGALAPRWSRELGVPIPVQPGKGYSFTTSRPSRCPRIPMLLPEAKIAVTPMRSLYRLGSTMELVGYDASIPPRRIDLLRRPAGRYLHEPEGAEEVERWSGWRPMTPDGIPIIGRGPRFENVWLATGHGMLGLSMAPATGRLVAQLVTGGEPDIPPAPYSPLRFGRRGR